MFFGIHMFQVCASHTMDTLRKKPNPRFRTISGQAVTVRHTALPFLVQVRLLFCISVLYFRVCRSLNIVCLHTIAHNLTLCGPAGVPLYVSGNAPEPRVLGSRMKILLHRLLRTSSISGRFGLRTTASTGKSLSCPEVFEGP
jgi:hypothetical protein